MVSLSGFKIKIKELISLIMLGNAKYFNLILNLSDINYQKTGVFPGSLETLNNQKNKKIFFDFNGSNSLIGSDDKHSYGSNYRLYFEIKSRLRKVLI